MRNLLLLYMLFCILQTKFVFNFAISGINIYNCEIRGGISLKIGEFIRSKRKEKNLTLKQLAKEIGLSHTYLSQIELGDRKASPDILNKMSKTLDVPHQYLMEKAGYNKTTDSKEIFQTQLLSLQEMRIRKAMEVDAVSLELSRSDLNEETRRHLEKVLNESKLEIEKIDNAIEEVTTLIRNSEILNQGLDTSRELNKKFGGWGNTEDIPIEEIKKVIEATQAKNTINKFEVETETKINLETLFNTEREIIINGKTLTDEEKQKALQILKLTFDR